MSTKRRVMFWSVLVGLVLVASVGGAANPRRNAGASAVGAVTILRTVSGDAVGQVTLSQAGNKLLIQADVVGLPPGFHGFHVHTTGDCDPATGAPFSSAGGHLNPGGDLHGQHAGDLPMIDVSADGNGSLRVITDRFNWDDLFDGDGSAVVLHAAPDNYAHIPSRYGAEPDATTLATGDAGGRIACGVLEPLALGARR